MTDHSKGWTPERREAQRLRALANKPWLHATGPRTKKGKHISAGNALKHGMRTAARIKAQRLLCLRDLYPPNTPEWAQLTDIANKLNEIALELSETASARRKKSRKQSEDADKRTE